MRTIQVYKFAELSPDAQQIAIETYRDSINEIHWSEENKETLEAFERVFPINISRWSYGDRGAGVSFSIVGENISELSGQRLATYIWNNYKTDLFKGKYLGCVESDKVIKHKRIRGKMLSNGKAFNPYYSAITLDTSCVLTGYYLDDLILSPVYKFLDKPEKTTNFEDLMTECFDEWVKACERDIEYQSSDEYISEHLTANEYEFTKEGKELC